MLFQINIWNCNMQIKLSNMFSHWWNVKTLVVQPKKNNFNYCSNLNNNSSKVITLAILFAIMCQHHVNLFIDLILLYSCYNCEKTRILLFSLIHGRNRDSRKIKKFAQDHTACKLFGTFGLQTLYYCFSSFIEYNWKIKLYIFKVYGMMISLWN